MNKECVILIHGLGREKSSMRKVTEALKYCGFDTVNWSYDSLTDDITHIALKLIEVVELNSIYHSKIHFVTHSMGGIILRRAIKLKKISKLWDELL